MGGSPFSQQANDLPTGLAEHISDLPGPRAFQPTADSCSLLLDESRGQEAVLPRVLPPEGQKQEAPVLLHTPDFLQVLPRRRPEVP